MSTSASIAPKTEHPSWDDFIDIPTQHPNNAGTIPHPWNEAQLTSSRQLKLPKRHHPNSAHFLKVKILGETTTALLRTDVESSLAGRCSIPAPTYSIRSPFGRATHSQKFRQKDYPQSPKLLHANYRIALGVVGTPLSEFQSLQELIKVVDDAMERVFQQESQFRPSSKCDSLCLRPRRLLRESWGAP